METPAPAEYPDSGWVLMLWCRTCQGYTWQRAAVCLAHDAEAPARSDHDA
jgi:hypothetical protein